MPCRQVVAKAEAVECVERGVRTMKDQAQLIVDNIETEKCELTDRLGGAAAADPTCDQAQRALSTIQSSDVDWLCSSRRHPPSTAVARVMDCVLLLFQRPLNAVELGEDNSSGCIRPSWNESAKVRNCMCDVISALQYCLGVDVVLCCFTIILLFCWLPSW